MAYIRRYSGARRSRGFFLSGFAHRKACVIVLGMDAVLAHFPTHTFAHQLGTSLILGTNGVKKPAILKVLVGAVGIEITLSSVLKDLRNILRNRKKQLSSVGN